MSIGFISAPDWPDPTPDEFRALTQGAVAVQQTFLDPPDFDYQMASIAGCEPQLTRAAQHLAGAECALIATPATPFGFIGHPDVADARARLLRMQRACGVVCTSSVVAIIEALEAWHVRKVALACTYFPDVWRDAWSAFVAASGFTVLSAQSLVDQGLKQPSTAARVAYPTTAQIIAAVSKMAQDCPAAEVIVVTGSGARTLAITETLRTISGKRIIAADTALYRKIGAILAVEMSLVL